MSWGLPLAWVLGAAGACGPVPPGEGRPEDAAAYLEVARTEALAGHRDTATLAYRQALALRPGDPDAVDGLAVLCAQAREDAQAALAAGLAALRAGQPTQARAHFDRARALAPLPEADFFAGVVRFEAGEYEAAWPFFEACRDAAGLAGPAGLYLGLLALRTGRFALANDALEATAATPGLASAAAPLRRLAARGGRLVLAASLEAGVDTNPTLATAPTRALEGTATVLGSALYRPLGRSGPFAEAGLALRGFTSARDVDAGLAAGSAGWRWERPTFSAQLQYDYRATWLGDGLQGDAHGPAAGAGWLLGPLLLDVDAELKAERYLPAELAPASGWRARGRAFVGLLTSRGTSLELGGQASRGLAQEPDASSWEGGPVARLVLPVGDSARLLGQAQVAWRAFDGPEVEGQPARADTVLDGRLRFEVDLGPVVSAYVRADFVAQWSSVPEAAFQHLVATAGVTVGRGFLGP